MIVLDENIIGIWYINVTEDSDWLGSLMRTDEGFKLVYRHRYYVDDKAHDSEDVKNWYEGTLSKDKYTEKEAITEMRQVTKMMSEVCGEPIVEEIMGPEGLDEFMERFQRLPFVHMQVIPDKKDLH